jgi:copper chaperone CopZ
MKTLITAILLLSTTFLSAQDKKKIGSLDIKTSTVCDMCETTIEENLIYEKGVKEVSVDLAASMIHVRYDPKRTDPSRIRTAVSKLGYMADEVMPDMKAFKNLPECCQKEGCGQPVEKK